MIVLHRERMVFVKARKTGGTSVEIALSRIAGPDDVITPIHPTDEQLRAEVGGRPPQNYRTPLWKFKLSHVKRLARGRWPERFYNHIPATAVRDQLGGEKWDDCFTFTVERNPWDKAISRYAFSRAHRTEPMPPFSEWLRQQPTHLLTCFDLYSDGTNIVVDHVIQFEQLQGELEEIWERMGRSAPYLPRAKSGYRQMDETRQSMFSDDDADFLRKICHREIDAFGYSFS